MYVKFKDDGKYHFAEFTVERTSRLTISQISSC